VETQGLTGRLSFHCGRRHQLKLDVLQLRGEGLIKAGLLCTTICVLSSNPYLCAVEDCYGCKALLVISSAKKSMFYPLFISRITQKVVDEI